MGTAEGLSRHGGTESLRQSAHSAHGNYERYCSCECTSCSKSSVDMVRIVPVLYSGVEDDRHGYVPSLARGRVLRAKWSELCLCVIVNL